MPEGSDGSAGPVSLIQVKTKLTKKTTQPFQNRCRFEMKLLTWDTLKYLLGFQFLQFQRQPLLFLAESSRNHPIY